MTKIYYDMDGVLVDFNRGLEVFNIKNDTSFIHKHRSEYTPAQLALDKQVVDCMNTEGFFKNLPPMNGYWDLWKAGGSFQFVLTAQPSTTKDPERCGLEKKQWIDKYITPLPEHRFIYCLRKEKALYATFDGDPSILIDDMAANCEAWEQAGGIAILFNTSEQSTNDLRKALKTLNG